MKMLFKLYLLGQLIAMPFMIGAIGNAFSSPDTSSAPVTPGTESVSNLTTLSNRELCETLHGPALNAVQDDIQQLKFITAELYDEGAVDDCFSESIP